jgi:hypothetical protein
LWQKISRTALDDQAEPARQAAVAARPEDVLRPLLVRGGRIKLPGPDEDSAAEGGLRWRPWPRGLEHSHSEGQPLMHCSEVVEVLPCSAPAVLFSVC